MHDLQKQILKSLMLTGKGKYSSLKPQGVEGNLFSYHLKNLVTEGLIELKSGHYHLTPKGKHYVDRLSYVTLGTRVQPKIVTLIVLKDKGKYLLYERKRMPFIDHVGFPYGKIHLEEHVIDAANRELLEKTGLSATLKHRGDVYITVHDEAELISHMLCHVFSGTKVSGELKGECFWSEIEKFPKNKLIPGVTQIEKLLTENKSNFFFAEYFLNSAEEV